MAVTSAQFCLVVVLTVDAFVVLVLFAASAYHVNQYKSVIF